MAVFELILCIIAAVVVSSFVSRFVPKVSTPLVQIVLGVLVTYLPFFPDAKLDPELFMVLFIAPLLYLEAHEIDKSALLKTLDLSLSLAIGLAIVTMAAVGFTLHAVWPSITLASALALGAALGPTDAVAVSSLGKEASLTQRQRSVLKGESLFNDASGIVGFQFALAAAFTGEFAVGQAAGEFVISFFGGTLFGLVIAAAANWLFETVRSLRLGNHHHTYSDGTVPALPAVFWGAEGNSMCPAFCRWWPLACSSDSTVPAWGRMWHVRISFPLQYGVC